MPCWSLAQLFVSNLLECFVTSTCRNPVETDRLGAKFVCLLVYLQPAEEKVFARFELCCLLVVPSHRRPSFCTEDLLHL